MTDSRSEGLQEFFDRRCRQNDVDDQNVLNKTVQLCVVFSVSIELTTLLSAVHQKHVKSREPVINFDTCHFCLPLQSCFQKLKVTVVATALSNLSLQAVRRTVCAMLN